MSNFGLDETLAAKRGAYCVRRSATVCDQAMMKDDLNVGSEQSGHMIFRDYHHGRRCDQRPANLRVMSDTEKVNASSALAKYPQASAAARARKETRTCPQ
jgi:hypothetical protein